MMIDIAHVDKSFGDNAVLKDASLRLVTDGPSHGVYCLMAPSGAGKTTLLRIILGLESADGGSVTTDMGSHPYSVVFQEDRLCENFSPYLNIKIATKEALTDREIKEEIGRLLPSECTDRAVKTLSGGMKRRVAILRAVLAPSRAILMDEPFTGLDEELRRLVIDYILKKRGGRLLLIATHQEEDVGLLGAELIRMPVSSPAQGRSLQAEAAVL